MSREEVLHFHRPSLCLYCATPALFSEFTRNEINGRESRLFARARRMGRCRGKGRREGEAEDAVGDDDDGDATAPSRPYGNEYASTKRAREDEGTPPRMRANAGDPSPSRASAENALRPKPSPSFFFALLGPRPRPRPSRPGVFARPLNTLVIYSAHVLSPRVRTLPPPSLALSPLPQIAFPQNMLT